MVGVLGGGAGTTRDAFELVAQAERYGARLALFGRKINLAGSQEQMIRHLRRVVLGVCRRQGGQILSFRNRQAGPRAAASAGRGYRRDRGAAAQGAAGPCRSRRGAAGGSRDLNADVPVAGPGAATEPVRSQSGHDDCC